MSARRETIFPIRNPFSLPGERVLEGFSETYGFDLVNRFKTGPVDLDSHFEGFYVTINGTMLIGRHDGELMLTLKRINFNYSLVNQVATRTSVRCILVYDRLGPIDPQPSALLTDPTNVLSPYNISAGRRFLVLYDRLTDLDPTGMPQTSKRLSYSRDVHLPYQEAVTTGGNKFVYGMIYRYIFCNPGTVTFIQQMELLYDRFDNHY